jgi:hypothetical protein
MSKITKEAKYMPVGETVDVEFEPRKSKAKLYDFDTIVEVLKNGKKYILPFTVKTENTMYLITKKLRTINGLKKAEFGKVKGTAHVLKTKKGKEYTSYQFVLYLAQ